MAEAAPDAATLRGCVEARQLQHLLALDQAYESGFLSLERLTGATPAPLLDALGTYAAYRRVLLQSKLASAVEAAAPPSAATPAYPPANRVLLSPGLLSAAAAGRCRSPPPSRAAWSSRRRSSSCRPTTEK